MSDPFGGRPFPKGVLIAVAILLATIIVAIATARIMGVSPQQMPLSPVVQERVLRFDFHEDGVLDVYDQDNGQLIDTIGRDDGGFVRGVLRSMARERMLAHVANSEPYRLAERTDGALTLEDPSTGILLHLRAFGEGNRDAFLKFLPAAPRQQ